MTRSEKQNRANKTRVVIIAVLAVLVVLVGGYTVKSTYYSDRFLPKTQVNGIDVGGLTVAEANQKMKTDLSNAPFVIKDKGKAWKEIQRKDLGWTANYQKQLKAIKSDQNPFSWGMSFASAADKDIEDGSTINAEKLAAVKTAVKAEIEQLNTTRTPTKNATVKQTATGFEVVPEKQGDTIDVEKATDAFQKAAESGKQSVDIEKYLAQPVTKKDDPKLQKEIERMNKIAKIKANYSINGETFQIPLEQINSWLIDDNGELSLDQVQVQNYVESLAQQYDTSKVATKFNSTKRGTVEVNPGTYSWTIQTVSEAKALTDEILKGKDFTRSPITKGSTGADHKLVDKTYIEVDLENQHMWYYKDGHVVLDTDIVSGAPKSPTPTGVDYVWSKETNKTLRGKNDDGTDYASPVKYWMPVDWTGVGIHDSDWQPAYGGSLWQTRGSHGCVNTPPDVMAKLYDQVEVGTPVIIF